jgi:hypothetical protein
LAHHWPLNGNGLDIAGGAHAISSHFVGSTENRFNQPNKAVIFSSGYFRLPSGVYFTQSDFTATVWIKIARHSICAAVFDFGNGPRSDNILFLATRDKTEPAAHLMTGVNTKWNDLLSLTTLNINTWYHLALVLERNTLYIYRDSVIIATRPNTSQPRSVLRNSNFIGGDSFAIDSGHQPLIGVMDDLRIYHRALTTPEIMQVMREDV